jgi:UDP-N-acetyl-D-galactosamine dehydrogenase
MTAISDVKIAVIGLGYVGLPLAVEFAKKFSTKGFDRNTHRIEELRSGKDSTLEVEEHEFTKVKDLFFTADPEDLRDCNFFIIAVPTPIDAAKRPDLKYLLSASETVGNLLKQGDYIVYESTVYPGATEETCIPVLEKASGLQFNFDFYCGYSPERINPGDKEHRLPDDCENNIWLDSRCSRIYRSDILNNHKCWNIQGHFNKGCRGSQGNRKYPKGC